MEFQVTNPLCRVLNVYDSTKFGKKKKIDEKEKPENFKFAGFMSRLGAVLQEEMMYKFL